MGKKFYNADVQKILKKHDINHFHVFVESVNSRAVQSQKRHVEDVYAQRQL